LEEKGYSFEVIPLANSELLKELKLISDEWLSTKNTKELGFSLGFFSENYLSNFPIAVIRKDGNICAFANILLGANNYEISIDLMRYCKEHENGLMDYLFISLIKWGKEKGCAYFSLGNAPLSGLERRKFAPLWNKVSILIYDYGEHFYNFKGLRAYKQKFQPEWKPKYIVIEKFGSLPKSLLDVAMLVRKENKHD
jgi:phosphatidylglycerol lysyltransferase